MKAVTTAELCSFDVEQLAAHILDRFRDPARKTGHHPFSLGAMLDFELTPLCLGKPVSGGVITMPGGGVASYAGNDDAGAFKDRFYESVEWLKQHSLIRKDRTQDNDDFIDITDRGRFVEIDLDQMLFIIPRSAQVLSSWFEPSVFHLQVFKDQGVSSGSAFLTSGSRIVTCKHNLENAPRWELLFAKGIKLEQQDFEVSAHPKCDLVILRFKSKKAAAAVSSLRAIVPSEVRPSKGAQVLTMGFPRVAQRHPSCLVEQGTFQGFTKDYSEANEFLTISNRVDGGCSGGPLIGLDDGRFVGVITELTSQMGESDAKSSGTRPSDMYGHATPAQLVKDLL